MTCTRILHGQPFIFLSGSIEKEFFKVTRGLYFMKNEFRFGHSQTLVFPCKCIICNKKPQATYNLSKTTISKPALLSINYRQKDIEIPVCKKHYFFVIFMRSLSFFSMGLMIFTGMPIFLSLGQIEHFYDMPIPIFLLFFVSTITYIYLQQINPIKIKYVSKYHFTVVFKKKEYADEVIKLNKFS